MGDHTKPEYQFLDFLISRNRQALYYQNNKQNINTKAYYLLLELVENQGRILSKDHLINTVWHGQIVTDAALAKQILRLRKIINDNDATNPIIETHRGVGYRFTATVTEKSKSQNKKHMSLGLVLVILMAFTLVSFLPKQSAKETNQAVIPADINLVLLSSSETISPINVGALNFLLSLLEYNSSINAFLPDFSSPATTSQDELAINLTAKSQLDYAALINFTESNNGYEAEIALRNQDTTLSKTSLRSKQLLDLTLNVNKWINQTLSTVDTVHPSQNNTITTNDDYALQSYIQGITEQQLNQAYSKAKEYFEAAVLKDPKFKEAWVQLAYVKLKLNEFTEAISIADTHLSGAASDHNNELQFDFHYIKALAYYRLQKKHKAKISIERSIESIEKNPNPIQKIHGLKSMTLLAYIIQDWDMAIKYLDEQLTLSQDYYPLDHQLGGLYFNKAEVYAFKTEFSLAREELTKAIHYFSKNNNPDNMLKSFALINKTNLIESDYNYGIQVANQAEEFLDKANVPHQKILYLTYTALIFNLTGQFDRSEKYITRMSKVAAKSDNKAYYIFVEVAKMHAFYVQDKFTEAYNHASAIKTTLENNYLPEEMAIIYSWVILTSSRANSPEVALQYYQKMSKELPFLLDNHANDMQRAKGHILVRLGQVNEGLAVLEKVEQSYRLLNEKHAANYVGFEILAILLNHPELNYQAVINRLDSNTQYDYLFFKLKAQFKAKESDYLTAAMLMQENKIKANQLWTAKDQLLLEKYMEMSQAN